MLRVSVLVAVLLGASAAFAETVRLDSPDGHLQLTFEVADDGGVTHALAHTEDYRAETREVSAADTLHLKLAPRWWRVCPDLQKQ